MATLTFISNSLSSPTSSFSSSSSATHNHTPPSLPLTASLFYCNNPSQRLILEVGSQKYSKKKSRGSSVITSAGPSTASYIFAFAFPMSLIAITVFTSIKIDDELDRKFLEEVALNQEILEAEAEEGGTDPISLEEKPEVSRKRNRPKREVEASSM